MKDLLNKDKGFQPVTEMEMVMVEGGSPDPFCFTDCIATDTDRSSDNSLLECLKNFKIKRDNVTIDWEGIHFDFSKFDLDIGGIGGGRAGIKVTIPL